MGNSLFDQLQKSGLVDAKKAQKIKRTKYKQHKKQNTQKIVTIDENKQHAVQVQAEKLARDKILNQQQKDIAEKKAIAAQIKQLIELNRLPDTQGNVAFNFSDNNTMQRLHLTQTLQKQLSLGQLAVVRLNEQYEIVPRGVAEKIKQRDTACVLVCNEQIDAPDTPEEDDPYAEYQIPDDLMW